MSEHEKKDVIRRWGPLPTKQKNTNSNKGVATKNIRGCMTIVVRSADNFNHALQYVSRLGIRPLFFVLDFNISVLPNNLNIVFTQ